MKKVILVAMVFCIAACAPKAVRQEPAQAVDKEKKVRPAQKKTGEAELRQMLEEADPLIENILQSLARCDYGDYIRDFNASMRSAYHDKRQFEKICKERKARIGTYVERRIWKIEKKNPFYVIYYWVKFTEARDPVTVRMVVERKEGPLKVGFLSFNPPALENDE